MNNITDHDWEYKGIDGAVTNDWYIVPLVIIFTVLAFISFVGVDNFMDVMGRFIMGIVGN